VRALIHTFGFQVVAFLVLHMLWAYPLSFSDSLGQWHAVVVLLYGLRAALQNDSSRVLYSLGYIAGAEVLWRMAPTHLFWEFGKYASVLIATAALLAERWHPRRVLRLENSLVSRGLPVPPEPHSQWSALPIAYILLLFPAAILTFKKLGGSLAWNEISFNLSGPLALAVLSLYLSRRPVNRSQLIRLLVALMAPVVGMAFLVASSTLPLPVVFRDNSNLITSGRYFPNQVSNLLGLGALAGVMFVTVLRGALRLRLIVMLVTTGVVAQALLTFSRGGVYSFLLAAMVFGLHLVRVPLLRRRLFVLAVIFALVASAFLPFLNSYTQGILKRRILAMNTSGRVTIMLADLRAFREHPLLGTGVGISRDYHFIVRGRAAVPHTEPSRMLAEHGILGFSALLILLSMLISGYRRAPPGIGKGLTAAFAVWAVTIMLHSAMRVVATSLGAGLALVTWNVESREGDAE